FRGWARVEAGHAGRGVDELRAALAAYRGTEAKLYLPYARALWGGVCRSRGDLEEGLAAVTEARQMIEATGMRGFEAQASRRAGELRQASGERDLAAECLQRAMAAAQAQRARLSELRRAVARASVWGQHGRRDDAYNLVS